MGPPLRCFFQPDETYWSYLYVMVFVSAGSRVIRQVIVPCLSVSFSFIGSFRIAPSSVADIGLPGTVVVTTISTVLFSKFRSFISPWSVTRSM